MQLTIDTVVDLILWLAGTFTVAQVGSYVLRSVAKRAGAKARRLRLVQEVIAAAWALVAATGILSITGLASEFTTLTVSGILGVAVSLALQSTLSNMIAGVLLLRDKAIRLGDEIQFGGVRGEIVQIGFRSTWIRTKEENIVVIGNSNLQSGPLINFSATSRFEHLSRMQPSRDEGAKQPT